MVKVFVIVEKNLNVYYVGDGEWHTIARAKQYAGHNLAMIDLMEINLRGKFVAIESIFVEDVNQEVEEENEG